MNKALEVLNESLQQLFEDQQKNNKIGLRITEVNNKLEHLHQDAKRKKKKLANEKSDFERIEKMNANRLFKTILGNKEEQIEKERQEYLQAALEYNSIVEKIEILNFELEVIGNKYKDEEIIQYKLQKLIVKKEKQLRKFDSAAAKTINRFDEKIRGEKLLLKEMFEADEVGVNCVKILNAVIKNLNKVNSWGYMDSRGYSSYAKKTSIEKSRVLVSKVEVELEKFSKELSDVYSNLNVDFKIENFNNFINIFFDNLITDWIIQRQIYNALNNIVSTRDKVNRLLANLKGDAKKATAKIKKHEEKKKLYVLNL